MSDAVRTMGQNVWLWRVILFKGINGWLITVASAAIAAHLFSPQQESIIGCAIAGNKFLEGFINQDIGQLKVQVAQALGISLGNTQFLTRQDTQQQTTSVQTFSTNPATETPTVPKTP